MTSMNADVQLIWDDPDGMPPEDQKDQIEAAIRDDIALNLEDCATADDLIMHMVFLDEDDKNGPSVAIFGGDDRLYCCYQSFTKWVGINEKF